eukprot:SAG31_NODE_1377_length_8589_cov_2.896584_5_plen_139_part_00
MGTMLYKIYIDRHALQTHSCTLQELRLNAKRLALHSRLLAHAVSDHSDGRLTKTPSYLSFTATLIEQLMSDDCFQQKFTETETQAVAQGYEQWIEVMVQRAKRSKVNNLQAKTCGLHEQITRQIWGKTVTNGKKKWIF